MSRFAAVVSTTIFLVMLTSAPLSGVEPFSAVGLPATDIVVITFHTQSLGPQPTVTVVLTGGTLRGYEGSPDEGSLDLDLEGRLPWTIEEWKAGWKDGQNRKEPIATIPWTVADALALDRLFFFYEGLEGKGDRCSRIDRLTVRRIRLPEGRTMATRSYRDATCQADQVEGALTMDELMRRLRAAVPTP